jgi:hypothetical protein
MRGGQMRNFFRKTIVCRTAAPLLVACLLVFQGALAGLASGSAGSFSGLIAQICTSGKAGPSDGSTKSVSRHGGSCCILHDNLSTDPEVDLESHAVLARVTTDMAPLPLYRVHFAAAAPELEASSPRGPPV